MMKYLFAFLMLLFCNQPAWAYNVAQAKADLKQGRYAETTEQLRQLVKTDTGNYEAWFLFGVALVHEQQYHQAIEAFRQVIALRPDLAEPHNNLAAVYNNLGDTKAAVRELEIALEKRPDYAIAEENLADLYVKLALQHYRHALKTAPNPVIEQRYARLIQVRNPIPETVQHTDTKTESTPPSPDAAPPTNTTNTAPSPQEATSLKETQPAPQLRALD